VQSGSTLADPGRFKFDADEFYLKTAGQMRSLFRELPQACDNTLLIAERCEVSFTEGEGRYMPRFQVPEGHSEPSWFVHEVEAGPSPAYPQGISGDVRARADYETEVICSKGYAGYFLVVADFINWAKSRGIRVGPAGVRRGADDRLRDGHHRPRPDPARADLRAVPQPRAACRCPTSTSTSTSAAR
jgi:DNA polymerase-3 subunit alpha